MLVFLPGQGKSAACSSMLEEDGLPRGVRVLPLFGDLSAAEQDAAIRPGDAQQRKVVLATNIAETSLTIEGVRVVVDSGLARRARFDPATGMSRPGDGAHLARVRRSATRARGTSRGRACAIGCGRKPSTHPCPRNTAPEILEADLAPLALELAEWGVSDPRTLRWLDPPPTATFSQARDLLRSLDAIDAEGRITAHGRALARLGTHPRLAHMIVRGAELGLQRLALRNRRRAGRTRSAALECRPPRCRPALAHRGPASGTRRRSARRGRRSRRRRRAATGIAQRRGSRTTARNECGDDASRGGRR